MFNTLSGSLITLLEIGALIVGVALVVGVLRLVMLIAGRFFRVALVLVVLLGIVLILMRFITIH